MSDPQARSPACRDHCFDLGASIESQLSLVVRNHLGELPKMAETVSAWCKENEVPAAAEFHVNLALEEIVSNVIRYGWKDGSEHGIHVRLWRMKDEIRIEVEDDALRFNPLEAPAVDVNLPLEERPVGGLGIHLVRQVMDSLEYRRLEGKNFFVMHKKMTDT